MAFVTFYSGYAQSQSPKGINFQAVARQFDGRPIANKQISIRISIAEGSASGNKEYVEQQFPTTNPLGLFDLVIGQGNRISGEFNAVNWSTGNKWIQIEIDPNGGTNFIILGSQQMLTVPYAFFADRAANVIEYTGGAGIAINESVITNTGDDDSDPGNELISNVSLSDDHKLLITDAGGTFEVNLGKFANEPLSLGEVLSIGNDAGENTISNLSDPINDQDAATKNYVDNLDVRDDDADPTNEIQDLELISNLLRITNNLTASAIDLSVYLDNTDNQTLALDNNELSISNGNSVDLNKYLDNTDNQNLSLDQNQLSISDGNSVDLSIYLDNTDSQNLSLQASGTLRIINIDNGEGVEINVADNDNDPQNEIQDLVLSNNVLTITEKSNPTLIDLSPYLDNTDNQDLSIIADNLNISGGTGVSLST
ncbi:MAG TPA: hypothetical protein PKC24_12190, partial [Cyclobacteriaceae bacterium]|nr:hypothetical protein [Cyclobacteriaceae bacterium]